MPTITIAGGGFAGVWAALAAAATRHRRNADSVEITLVSKEADLCVRPRLYEGARPEMLVPLRPLLDAVGVAFLQGEIAEISGRDLRMTDGSALGHDRLVLALGSHVAVPDIPVVPESSFTVDGYADTARLDAHLAVLEPKSTVVVVGASFSGLEIATHLRARLGPEAEILLIDRAAVAGQSLGPSLTGHVGAALDRAGVRFLGNETAVRVADGALHLTSGRVIDTRTVVFATGLRPSPLVSGLGASLPDGRLEVDPTLRLPGHRSVFAAGDLAAAWADDRHRTLMSCQHAMPMGLVAGQNAVLDLIGGDPVPYTQPGHATCLSLGADAVFTRGWERTVVLTGAEGAAMKAQINESWIYPPSPALGREAIFDAVLPPSSRQPQSPARQHT